MLSNFRAVLKTHHQNAEHYAKNLWETLCIYHLATFSFLSLSVQCRCVHWWSCLMFLCLSLSPLKMHYIQSSAIFLKNSLFSYTLLTPFMALLFYLSLFSTSFLFLLLYDPILHSFLSTFLSTSRCVICLHLAHAYQKCMPHTGLHVCHWFIKVYSLWNKVIAITLIHTEQHYSFPIIYSWLQ